MLKTDDVICNDNGAAGYHGQSEGTMTEHVHLFALYALPSYRYRPAVVPSSFCSVVVPHAHPRSVIVRDPDLFLSPCSVIIPPALSSSPCSLIVPLLCHRFPAVSSFSCCVIVPKICHRPPALS